MHVNKTNGKAYVGITGVSVKERWKYGQGYRCSPHFYNAIKKYGWDGFEHYILCDHMTMDDAIKLEADLIAAMNLTNDDYGYNISKAGKEIYKHCYDGHANDDYRKKISDATKGQNHRCYGKHLPEITRKRISESQKGKTIPDNETVVKPVVCVETGRFYISATDAAKQFGLSRSAISSCIVHPNKRAAGFHWQLYNPDGRFM